MIKWITVMLSDNIPRHFFFIIISTTAFFKKRVDIKFLFFVICFAENFMLAYLETNEYKNLFVS